LEGSDDRVEVGLAVHKTLMPVVTTKGAERVRLTIL
jgi:hypothetical protein